MRPELSRGQDWRLNLGRVNIEMTFKTKETESHTKTACRGEKQRKPSAWRESHL